VEKGIVLSNIHEEDIPGGCGVDFSAITLYAFKTYLLFSSAFALA